VIEVKQAVKLASDYLRSLYDAEDVKDVRLEEVVLEDPPPPGAQLALQAVNQAVRNARWLITLSFARFPGREYKEIEIDADSGGVKAMRIRTLSNA
jgi:hypothetical protein